MIKLIGLAEFRGKPTRVAQENPITCILGHNKELFYTVEPSRMKELLEAELKFKGLQDGKSKD